MKYLSASQFILCPWRLVVLIVALAGVPSALSVTEVGSLKRYTLAAAPVFLEKLATDASGITWNNDRKSLFVIRNTDPVIQELDRTGRVLREIKLVGFSDTEGVSWMGGNLFAILEERRCAVVFVQIKSETQIIHRAESPVLDRSDMNHDRSNRGCEDIAWDQKNKTLYLSREKEPVRIERISGISAEDLMKGKLDVTLLETVSILEREFQSSLWRGDISGLHMNSETGDLLILSDDSKSVTTMSSEGILSMPFSLGGFANGLLAGIPQPEGVTMDDQGRLFVLSEPHQLYTFESRVY